MENNTIKNQKKPEQEYFLSEVIGAKVRWNGKKIGTLSDLVIVETSKIPEVTHLVIIRSFGYPSLLVPMNNVQSFGRKEITIGIESIEQYEKAPPESVFLLKDHILDKKVLDIEDKEVEVVYDIRLVHRNGKIYVTDVDVSRYGLLRRIGLKVIADIIHNFNPDREEQMISWTLVQPLPSPMGSFRGNVKLNVLMETLSEIHPVDLADILEELDNEQRLVIFSELDTEQASDTLEEINPNVQREIVSSLKRERVVQLIDEMTPGQAADILSVLPASDAEEILAELDSENVKKIRAILDRQEETIVNYTTPEYIRFPPETTAEQAMSLYATVAKGKDVIMYLYVIDASEHLLGVIDIKELLQAEDNQTLADIMVFDYISLSPDSTLKEAKEMFNRYDFRALPVTDDDNRIVGVVPYRDVMNLTHHFIE
ncbi:MAG TPA: CBS domain-containing protein [Methanoregulaceae archaeon]|nr:CBS domain-containing protein [Methanoregulaceae archaeon]